MSYEPELGQAVFGGPWESLDTPGYVTAGFDVIASRIASRRGLDPEGMSVLTANSGEGDYVSDVFAMRSYCWCDGSTHPDGCPPNFEHAASGFVARWYKHANRGQSCNRLMGAQEWSAVLAECLAAVPDGVCNHVQTPKEHSWAPADWGQYWECDGCGAYGFGDEQYGDKA